jgi:hypothetical protein
VSTAVGKSEASTRRLLLIGLGTIAATLILLGLIFGNLFNIENPDHFGHFPWLASGLVWIGVGALAWERWPATRMGAVLVLGGFAHYLYGFGLIPTSPTWLLGYLLGNLVLLITAYAFLGYPDGRLRTVFDRRLFAVLAGWWVISAILTVAVNPHDLNPLRVVNDESTQNTVFTINDTVLAILTLVVAARVAQRWWTAQGARRSVHLPIVLALIPYIATQAAEWLGRAIGDNLLTDIGTSWPLFFIQNVALPLAVLYAVVRVPSEQVEAAAVVEPAAA